MAEESHGRWHRLRLFKEKWFLPALTAYVANYLLRGRLQPLAEQLPEPWADVIAHPIIEFLLDLLIAGAVFLGTYFVRKLARYMLTWFVIVAIVHYVLVRYAHAPRFALYFLWCSVIWTMAAVLLFQLRRAVETQEAELDNLPGSLVPNIPVPDENGVVMPPDTDDQPELFGGSFYQVIWLTFLSGVMSLLAVILLGLTLHSGAGLQVKWSIIVSLIAGAVLAAIHWWARRNKSEDLIWPGE